MQKQDIQNYLHIGPLISKLALLSTRKILNQYQHQLLKDGLFCIGPCFVQTNRIHKSKLNNTQNNTCTSKYHQLTGWKRYTCKRHYAFSMSYMWCKCKRRCSEGTADQNEQHHFDSVDGTSR